MSDTNPSSFGLPGAGAGIQLSTEWVESLPIVNEFLRRMRLREFLEQYLPPPSKTPKVSAADVVLTLVRNLLLCREPLYGVNEWAKCYAHDLIELTPEQLTSLNDDRVGRCLDDIFQADYSSLVIAVSTHVVKEFGVEVKEFHNDSTTVSFYGRYEEAAESVTKKEKPTLAITHGRSKGPHLNLKQVLFILTTSYDQGVPLYFSAANGNTSDSKTHIKTWEFLRSLTGRSDFLYVADSKLASAENMDHIHQNAGRFVTVLPQTFRREISEFQEFAQTGSLQYHKMMERGGGKNVFSLVHQTQTKSGGYRLLWYHSTGKQKADAEARTRSLKRMRKDLQRWKERLALPKTRFRDKNVVEKEIGRLITRTIAAGLIQTAVTTTPDPSREDPDRQRLDVTWEIDQKEEARRAQTDGFFPLVTNDVKMKPRELLLAHKRQPVIEKRFSQLKTGLHVAPVLLHESWRVEGLLCVFYFAMMTQILMQRHLRRTMKEKEIPSLPLYYEHRTTKSPTAMLIFRNLLRIQRHTIQQKGKTSELVTSLNPTQQQMIELFGLNPDEYGHTPRHQTRTAPGP